MSKLFVIVLIGILVHFCASYTSQLLLVLAICKHGSRAPSGTYPKDPFKDRQWGVDYGQLTNEGKMNQYNLGKWFRKRYDGFLPKKYSQYDFVAFSADADRCLQSAAVCAAGIYPPTEPEQWNRTVRWQPIPIHASRDAFLYRKIVCPKHTRLLNELYRCEVYQKVLRENEKFFKYMSDMTGEKVKSLEDVKRLFKIINTQRHFNVTFPEWIQNSFEKMLCLTKMELISHTYTTELARLRTGPMVHCMFKIFDDALTNGTASLKFIISTGYDDTLVHILNALKIYDYHWPQAGDTLLIELRKDNKKSFVNMFYKNSSQLSKLELKDCKFSCELSKFKAAVEPIRISMEDWDQECYT